VRFVICASEFEENSKENFCWLKGEKKEKEK
jgi:hypothetical protein